MALGLAIVLAYTPGHLWAGPWQGKGEPDPEAPTVVTIRPAGEPVPALKYRLLPEHRDQIRGNAAVFYHRAVEYLLLSRGSRPPETSKDTAKKKMTEQEQIDKWAYVPISEIPRDQARELLASRFAHILDEVELGALRTDCDWEYDQRKDPLWFTLLEMQELRGLARLVAVKARLAILDGKTDEAFHWISVGLTMGRHAAQGPFMVLSLVGSSVDSLMNQCLLELIQAPSTPSLVWALADRPRPFIDMRNPQNGERFLLEKTLPELSHLDSHVWSDDEARQFADTLQRRLFSFSGEIAPVAPGMPEDTASLGRRLKIAAMAAEIYPEAVAALIARGWPEAKIKAMPVIQVACLHTYFEFRKMRDETYKWLNVPYYQSFDKLDKAQRGMTSEKLGNPLLILFNQLIMTANSSKMAFVRLERQFDTLQVIEAIRLYAHLHEGKLPTSLEAMTDSPVPLDPATGKPFGYKLTGDSATLSAPIVPGMPNNPNFRINYLLKPAR